MKEEKVNRIKRLIEMETSEKEVHIQKLRQDIDEQKQVIENQRKLLNELQILNDFTQQDLVKASRDLHRRQQDKTDLLLKFNEHD